MEKGYIDEHGEYQDPPNHCPACGTRLDPFMGPERKPATSWAHPKHTTCTWSEHENLTNRQIAGIKGAATRAHKAGSAFG